MSSGFPAILYLRVNAFKVLHRDERLPSMASQHHEEDLMRMDKKPNFSGDAKSPWAGSRETSMLRPGRSFFSTSLFIELINWVLSGIARMQPEKRGAHGCVPLSLPICSCD
jgi:hypothetical protein